MLKTSRNNFEWEGGGRLVSHLTDLWLAAIWSKEGRFFVGVSQHLQLVVALDCFIFNKLKIRITLCLIFIKLMLKCVLNCCCSRGLPQESLLCQFVNIVVTVIPSCAQTIQTCSWAGVFMGFVILPFLLRCTNGKCHITSPWCPLNSSCLSQS